MVRPCLESFLANRSLTRHPYHDLVDPAIMIQIFGPGVEAVAVAACRINLFIGSYFVGCPMWRLVPDVAGNDVQFPVPVNIPRGNAFCDKPRVEDVFLEFDLSGQKGN